MRQIKFRAWNPKEKTWVGADVGGVMDLNYSARCNAFMFDNDNPDLPEDVIFCQYTGLKDKNGKEIYEGDRLGNIWEDCWVVWCPKCCGFQIAMESVPCSACEGEIYWCELVDDKNIEVIGNIYENPELVKLNA